MKTFVSLTLIVMGLLAFGQSARADQILVFAAASLSGALDAVNDSFDGPKPTVAYAASSTLARQVVQGAPAEVVLSANPAWMDYLEDNNAIDPASRINLLSNRLVVVARAGSSQSLGSLGDLPAQLGTGRVALALTQAVPAGIYARSAFESAGIWNDIASKTAETDNVRAALQLVIRGETPYGVVYATDAASTDQVEVILEIAPKLHQPIVYPVALGAEATEAARAYLKYLMSQQAAAIFARHGFGLVPR